MYLTEEQKKTLQETYGEKAPKLISHLLYKKGKSILFKDDNTLMHSKEETEKRIMKTSPKKKINLPLVVETDFETLSRVVEDANRWEFSSIKENEDALEKVKELKKIIEEKKQASIKKSIAALENTINEATNALNELKKKEQKKGETSEQKEGEASKQKKGEAEASEASEQK